MVFGWLCGGHAGLRPRLEHQEHDFDKSNFCFKNLPNMADLPDQRPPVKHKNVVPPVNHSKALAYSGIFFSQGEPYDMKQRIR